MYIIAIPLLFTLQQVGLTGWWSGMEQTSSQTFNCKEWHTRMVSFGNTVISIPVYREFLCSSILIPPKYNQSTVILMTFSSWVHNSSMISYGNDQGWKYSLNYCIERSQIRRGTIRDSQRQKTISTKKGANISVTLPIKNKHQQNVYIHISMKKKILIRHIR